MSKELYIVDTTLRDGEQAPGVAFTREEKVEIAKFLDSIGVNVIEAGIPAMGEDETETIKEIVSVCKNSEIITWNRLKKSDIDASLKTGVKMVHISAPASDIQIWNKLQKDRKWVLKEVEDVLSYANSKGLEISFGAEDSSRANVDFLDKLYETAVKSGATRVRYADTLGILTPFEVLERVKRVRKKLNVGIDFHGHNDFGMATANAVAAFRAGAEYISCSVNGLGERAGNTPLDEIVMAVRYLEKGHSDINIKKFMELAEIVEKSSGRKIWDSKPVVGRRVFSHESGIHVDGIMKSPENYEFYPPEEVGRTREIVLGKHSGASAVVMKLKEMGIIVSKLQAADILNKIKDNIGKDNTEEIWNFCIKNSNIKSI